jgi:hypothetical protein
MTMPRRISDNRSSVLERLYKIEQAINNNAHHCHQTGDHLKEGLVRVANDMNSRLIALEQTPFKRLVAWLTGKRT